MTDDHGEIRTSRVECRDGVLIAIHHFGGGPTPLLVLAALGFPSKAYLPLVAPLQDRFTCYGVDLRGHGDSPSGPGTDLLYHGEDVCTVVRSLGLEGACAFGHSLGGMAAVQAETLQPGTFSRIICYEPVLYSWQEDQELRHDHIRWTAPRLLKKVLTKRQRYYASRQEALRRFSGKPPWNRFAKEALEAYVEHGFKDVSVGVELKCDPANESNSMIFPTHLDPMLTLYPSLPKVGCPVSILAGSDVSASDPTQFIASFIEKAVKEFPNARFERLKGLQHLGPLEDPERIAKCILAHAGQAPSWSGSRSSLNSSSGSPSSASPDSARAQASPKVLSRL
ncbi:hypothetical protein WJX84_010969 [Apatococcus fuscideae]|uniref:AB hydrolase-1 domain-containing protein n=1 Tax=Apatococcus fuscideae TaxID=2026836 RepID=A0AAW1SR09_9CHLO